MKFGIGLRTQENSRPHVEFIKWINFFYFQNQAIINKSTKRTLTKIFREHKLRKKKKDTFCKYFAKIQRILGVHNKICSITTTVLSNAELVKKSYDDNTVNVMQCFEIKVSNN